MKLSDIMGEFYSLYNPKSAENWDNTGLLIGNTEKDIKKTLFCLDLTMKVIDEAINKNIDLIVSHHPGIFSGLKKITNETLHGEKILKLIENKIALYSIHTNADFAMNGLNDFIMEKLELQGNIEVYNEREYIDYNPFKNINEINRVATVRIKYLNNPMSLENLINQIKYKLGIKFVRYVGNKETLVSRIGLVTGGGSSFMHEIKDKIDVFLTGDLRHHESLDALEEGKILIDIGHYESEYLFVDLMMREMGKFFNGEMIPYYDEPVFQLG